MHFCSNCDNMYYIKLEEDNCNKIIYYCRNCGNSDNNLLNMGKCVLKENISNSNSSNNISSVIINKYTKLDRTVPRINYIKCPNEICTSNIGDFDVTNREILYIRYDHINMKYIYLCSHCDYTWNTEK